MPFSNLVSKDPVVYFFYRLENANVYAAEKAAASQKLTDSVEAVADAKAAVDALTVAKDAVLKMSASSEKLFGRGCKHMGAVVDDEMQFAVTLYHDAIESEGIQGKKLEVAKAAAKEAEALLCIALQGTANLGLRRLCSDKKLHSFDADDISLLDTLSYEVFTPDALLLAPAFPRFAPRFAESGAAAERGLRSCIRKPDSDQPKKRARFAA
jgi:hypothetical protein